MDGLIQAYGKMSNLQPLDYRLLNWHYANLEYANAANVYDLSLGGWDQDGGNEFEGRHSQIVGGYSQVPRALLDYPTPLDVRLEKPVPKITYSQRPDDESTQTFVETEAGEVFNADYVVLTVPLGVLQQKSIEFKPSLPEWKTGAIHRLGFGLLNKVSRVRHALFSHANSFVGHPSL